MTRDSSTVGSSITRDGAIQEGQGPTVADATAIRLYAVIGNGALDDGHRATGARPEGKSSATAVGEPTASVPPVVGERAVDETEPTAVLVEKTPARVTGDVVVDDTLEDEDRAAAGKEAPSGVSDVVREEGSSEGHRTPLVEDAAAAGSSNPQGERGVHEG